MGSRTKRTKRCSLEDFVRAWAAAVKSGGGLNEVAEKTGLARNSAQSNASRIRRLGIPLARMPGRGRPKANRTPEEIERVRLIYLSLNGEGG